MQKDRLRRLFKAGKAKRGLSLDEARRILWMYTSRDVYRMLVVEGGWTPDRYGNGSSRHWSRRWSRAEEADGVRGGRGLRQGTNKAELFE